MLRFDDVLADALELGWLRQQDFYLSDETLHRISTGTPEGIPVEVVELLVRYYATNKPEDSDWVVLPVTNVDAYFGNTNFSRKWWNKVPESIIVRQKQSFGVCRYMVNREFFDSHSL